jgi:hypothetical protein
LGDRVKAQADYEAAATALRDCNPSYRCEFSELLKEVATAIGEP